MYIYTSIVFDRFVTGLGVGGTIAVCGLYAYEMTSRNMRGLLCCSIQLPVAFGILVSYVIGKYVAWNVLAAINASLLIPYWILIKTTPESPYFLVGRGKEYSASKSIEWLYGRDVNITDHELFQIKQVEINNEIQCQNSCRIFTLRTRIIAILVRFCYRKIKQRRRNDTLHLLC